jgi:hypothetical protein
MSTAWTPAVASDAMLHAVVTSPTPTAIVFRRMLRSVSLWEGCSQPADDPQDLGAVLGRLPPRLKPGQHGHTRTLVAFAEPGTDVSLQDVQVAFVERPQGLVSAAIRSQPQR